MSVWPAVQEVSVYSSEAREVLDDAALSKDGSHARNSLNLEQFESWDGPIRR